MKNLSLDTKKLIGIHVLIALGLLAVGIYMTGKWYDIGYLQREEKYNNEQADIEFRAGIPPTETPIPTPTTSLATYTWYKVALNSRSSEDIAKLGGMISVFGRALYKIDFPQGNSSADTYNNKVDELRKVMPRLWVGYKIDETSKPFDRSNGIFYIPSVTKLIESTYVDGPYDLTVSQIPEREYRYLSDKKYCENDNDCTIRESYCNIGAYNQYDQFPISGYGCGGGAPYPEIGYEASTEFGQFLNCQPVFKYTHATCIHNKCVAQGLSISCNKQ